MGEGRVALLPQEILHLTQRFGIPWWLRQERIRLQCRRPEFDSWVGKIPWRREWLPTPVFWPREFHGLYTPWDHKESDTTEWLSLSTSNILQESMATDSSVLAWRLHMDRGVWQAIFKGVAKSQTQVTKCEWVTKHSTTHWMDNWLALTEEKCPRIGAYAFLLLWLIHFIWS